MALRTIITIALLGLASTAIPTTLPMFIGPFIAGGSFGALLVGYLWKAGDDQSWNLVSLPVALLFPVPFAITSGVAFFTVADLLTRNSLGDGIRDTLTMFCMGAGGAVPVFAAFAIFHLREPIKSVIGPVLLLAAVPGIVSVVAYNLAGSPHPNHLLADSQPELMIGWQTSVAVLLGCLEATHVPQLASTLPEELVS